MEQAQIDKIIKVRPRGYWMPTLYLASIVIVGIGGFMAGSVDASSGLLANVQEAFNNVFGVSTDDEVKVFDIDEFVPGEFDGGADRIIAGISEPRSPTRVSNVSAREPLACSFESEDTPSREGVLINEIAWMGGLDSEGLTHADEWIELANASGQVVDISGWSLIDQRGDIEVVFPEGTILLPGGFLLLERSNDDSVPGVTADLIYVGALSNQDEGLRLFDDGCALIDEALADPTWVAGDATARRTMERSLNLDWHTFSGALMSGIYGTPSVVNSEPIEKDEEEEEEKEEEINEEPKQDIAICKVDDQTPSYEVLINEVAWSGQSGNPSGEWIELKNNTNSKVNLTNWQLIDAEQSIKIFFEGEEIDQYLLLGRIPTTADSGDLVKIGTQTVDKTYTGILQNSDEALYLFNENCELVDKVDGVGSNWSNIGGSASPEYKSAERTSLTKWHTYSGTGIQAVMGTPRAANSQPEKEEPTGGGGGSQTEIEEEPEPEPEPAEVILCEWEQVGEVSREMLINEVAWMGGLDSQGLTHADEWIELKNISDEELDISHWQVLDIGGDIHIVFPEETHIAPDEFLLLERKKVEDESVPGVDIDLRYTGALGNSNEGLRLLDKDCMLVDEVLADPAWPAGDNTSKRTMERTDDFNWQTFVGEEATSGIWGTPKADNSEEEDVGDEDPVEDEEDADDTQEDESDKDEGGEEAAPELININTASLDDLQEITGVGPVIAQRIIDYREANGFFASIEEIKEVDGIGDVTFEEMKDEITIGGG
ncbi:MAG: lamin tail domain-containing protein [Candidatus Colwellbacteria bacterium]